MPLIKDQMKKLQELKNGERTLLQEAHELVVNEECPDLPEALDLITDQENESSLMHLLIEGEDYEECAKILKDKNLILSELEEKV